MFADDFFFLSLSGAGETQTPLGFVLPLVSLLPRRALRPQPVLRRLHLHQGIRPAPVFFYDVGRLSGGSWSLSVWGLLGLWVGSGREGCCMHMYHHYDCGFGIVRFYTGNRTVTLVLQIFPPFRRGKCCPFFLFGFLRLARCPLSFSGSSSLLRFAVWKNYRERTFVFGCRCWSCVFR